MKSDDTTKDTIVAIATAAGKSGIAVVRMCGPASLALSSSVLKASRDPGKHVREMVYGRIVDNGETIDEVLACYMKAPHSYTGDDVVEIQCHGGSASAHAILELLARKGARLAEPGEFTKRAFLNHRIDLVQAESVMEIVSAEGREHLRRAERLMDGTFSKRIASILSTLDHALSLLELNIDFLHQGGIDAVTDDELSASLGAIIETMNTMIASYAAGKRIRNGVNVVLAGAVNAGKSSLFNALLGRKRAIVNGSPGTTRDWLEEHIDIDGLAINLIDTAGLRDTHDDVEREGVFESERLLRDADIIVHLDECDGSAIFFTNNDVPTDRVIRLLSKSDTLKDELSETDRFPVSSVTGEGIDRLKNEIVKKAREIVHASSGDSIILVERHLNELTSARDSVKRALESLGAWSEEVTVLELKEAQSHIESILGRNVDIDVLDTIFSRFCIGK